MSIRRRSTFVVSLVGGLLALLGAIALATPPDPHSQWPLLAAGVPPTVVAAYWLAFRSSVENAGA